MDGKGRVVAAAVLCMEHKGKVEQLCFKLREFLIRAEQAQQVFRCGERRIRLMQKQALVILIVAVCLIAVDRDRRELRNQLSDLSDSVIFPSDTGA